MSGRVIPFPRPSPEPEPNDLEFEELTRVRDQTEALVVKSLLEAHGIRTLLRTQLAQSVHPFTVGDQGEVRLLVPAADLAEARRLLTRLASDSSLP